MTTLWPMGKGLDPGVEGRSLFSSLGSHLPGLNDLAVPTSGENHTDESGSAPGADQPLQRTIPATQAMRVNIAVATTTVQPVA